jgi:hypothetical protein
MIGYEDASHTYEYGDHYKILPAIHSWSKDPARIKNGRQVAPDFTYRSDNNSEWMDVGTLRSWIEHNRDRVGKF